MINIKLRKHHPEARMPTRGTPFSVGWDLYAFAFSESGKPNTCIVPPKSIRAIEVGLDIELPSTHYGMVCSRSGLAMERTLFVANAPGIIDPDYRGPIKILLYNGGYETQYIKHEDRIAQLLIVPVVQVMMSSVEQLTATIRGSNGFGSTGR